MEIKGSNILITGANRGIGKAVAQMLATSGASLILANRTIDEKLTEELKNLGAKSVEQVVLDLGSKNEIQKFINERKDQDIDILFNNAGQLTGGQLEEQPIDEIYSMLQVNINALIQMTHGFLPNMLKRKHGKIINHASVMGVMRFPGSSTYAASKAAVIAFTESLQSELKGTGVSTLTLFTPGIETRMFKDIEKKYEKNFDLSFLTSIPPKKYADMIREAILEDLTQLKPGGVTGVGLRIAQHAPQVLTKLVQTKFNRT